MENREFDYTPNKQSSRDTSSPDELFCVSDVNINVFDIKSFWGGGFLACFGVGVGWRAGGWELWKSSSWKLP
jgi:hypothetical protein